MTCESILRSIIDLACGLKCYITFMARESSNGDLVEYQAKTDKRIWQKKTHVIFCRPTPDPKGIHTYTLSIWFFIKHRFFFVGTHKHLCVIYVLCHLMFVFLLHILEPTNVLLCY